MHKPPIIKFNFLSVRINAKIFSRKQNDMLVHDIVEVNVYSSDFYKLRMQDTDF